MHRERTLYFVARGMASHFGEAFENYIPRIFFTLVTEYFSLKWQCFPDSSVDKESSCNAGDPGSVPGWGRSAGEGIGYPLQFSQASFVAQLVKNLPAIWETWVRSLGREDPLEKGKATHSSILAWRISWTV